jgi:predicted O-linked N-acetylglucosamine transferase (SPINDLY family)
MMLDTVMLDVNRVVAQALTHHRAGRFGEAERLYRQVLAVDPRHADSLHLLGVVSHQVGRDDAALDLIGKAIALNDRVADYHCNIGSALCGLGRSEEGLAHYMRAIALDPRHALACNNLGNALVDRGNLAEGEARLRRAVDLKPDYHEAHYNLGNALAAQDRLDEAVAHYRRAIALAPRFANAHNNLATTLEKQGRSQEAATEFARVLEMEPQHASAHYNLGNLLRANAEYEAAIGHYKQALASRPDFADAWNNMGVALAERGDLEAARQAYQRSVEAEPARAAYHRNLAVHKRFEPGDPQLAVLEELARNPHRVPEHEQIDLRFALGKAYADLKQHERSFGHLLAGNALKRTQIAYDESAAMAYMGRIRATFGAELMRAKAGAGNPSPTPVFIVGMPRSGTTLIEQIIASHPSAAGAGELFDLDNIARSVPGFPDTVSGMSAEELGQLGARYVAATQAVAPAAGRVADKMPWNFHFCGLIHLALPNARIIHARRDAIDTCLSCFSILFDGNSNLYTYDLGELGRFYRAYESLMAHWRAILPPGVMLEVQYEDVVADLEAQARRIVAHCGLAWDDACLAFHKTRRPVRTSSVAQVRQPIYNSSVGRWRPYRHHLRPLFDGLGFDPTVDSERAFVPDTIKPPEPKGQNAIVRPATRFDIDQTLGTARALHHAGRLDEAEGLYRQILAVDPDHVEGLHLLGVVAHQGGRNDLAAELIGKAIARNDRIAEFHCNIGSVLGALGRLGEAEAHYRRAIGLNPRLVESYNNLGNALKDQGRLNEAEGLFRHAIALRPRYPEAHYNLGNVLLDQGRTEEAVASYRQAIDLSPGMATAHYNLAHALKDQGKLIEAVECYRQAAALAPDWPDAHNNLGTVLHDLDRLTEAEACFRRALALQPENDTALDNLATVLRSAGRVEEAIACLNRALAIDPDRPVVHTNLIFALNFLPSATTADHQAERSRWDERHARRFAGAIRPHDNDPDPQRRLRIGFVSGHFCHQAATFAFAGAILHHDPKEFEVICYSDTPREDHITEQLRARADKWQRTARLNDQQLAELIRADRIDILVDPAGHMSGNRLLVFARKPAPIQVTAWGEPTGTGLKTMDYLLSDPVLVPREERNLLPEKVVDLPNFLGYWAAEPLPAPGSLPALGRGYVTFGSFNRLDKVQEPVVRAWAEILRAMPGARIVIKNRWLSDPAHRDRLIGLFAGSGVAPERVELLSATARADHFDAYRGIDLALDPFPHGGGMTTLDALWMGVPVVTFPGRTISSRLAAASLTAASLTDFIAADVERYVALAIAKASDLPALAALRESLPARMGGTDFGDPVRYARAVETAFHHMWQCWCAKRVEIEG